MSKHAPPEERKSNILGKEDFANLCWYLSKSIAHASDNEILEEGGTLNEWRAVLLCGEEVRLYVLVREFEY